MSSWMGKFAETDGKFEEESLEPIPKGTQVVAYIEDAQIDEGNEDYGTERHIKLQWRIHKPEEYQNRVIFQKVRVWHDDRSKQERAMRILAAIDKNCGGGLASLSQEPGPSDLQQHLLQKPMIIKLDVWEFGDRTGNWVQAVAPKEGDVKLDLPKTESFSEDDIPF